MSENNYTPEEQLIAKSDNKKIVLIAVGSTLAILLAIGGIFALGQNFGGNNNESSSAVVSLSLNSSSKNSSISSSSSSTSTMSSSSSTAVSSSSSSSATQVSSSQPSSSSSASVNTNRTFSSSSMPITFTYDKDWTVPTVASFGTLSGSGTGGYEAVMSKNSTILKISYYTNAQNTGGPVSSCYEPDAVLPIGSGWTRLRVIASGQFPMVNVRLFTNEVPGDFEPGGTCPGRAFTTAAGPGNPGKYRIELRNADNQRDVADELVKSIKF